MHSKSSRLVPETKQKGIQMTTELSKIVNTEYR